MNKKISIIPFIWISLFLYFVLTGVANIKLSHLSIFLPSRLPYYNYLIDAFFHGRTYIEGSLSHHDLSLFHNKWYMYWGPAPVLFVLPFYLIFGLQASDIVYTVIAGICNIILFYFVMEEFIKYFKLQVSPTSKYIVVASFAFTSPHLYLSVIGGIWPTNQIIATLYLLLYYLFFFKYLNSNFQFRYLIFSIVFFNLAWFSRYILFFNILLFVYPFYLCKRNFLAARRVAIYVVAITIFFLGLYGGYNYLRFGSLLETGHKYQIANLQEFDNAVDKSEAMRYTILQKQGKVFSIQYVPQNIVYYFFHHASLSINHPYVLINKKGNSIFSTYPIFILIAYLFRRKVFLDRSQGYLIYIISAIVVINMTLLLSFVMTGWQQFGSRYFLDVVPLLLILITIIIKDVPYSLQYSFLLYGIVINIIGIIHYSGLF